MEQRIGISGWRYEPWRGTFYPKGLVQKKELHYASRQLNSIEINGTFYSFQSPKSFKNWHDDTPDDFVFAVKCPQYITHIRRLKEVEMPLNNFLASGVLHLNKKLGPFLWQFPPNFIFYEDRLETFFKMLPKTFSEAAKLTKKSDRFELDLPKFTDRPLRHAIEIRNHSFENPFFIEMLQHYNIALVFADTAGKWPYMEDITSDFLYLRLHGDEELYKSGYTLPAIRFWADRLRLWQKGKVPKDALTINEAVSDSKPRDFYVYFDNDVKVKAPFDAMKLRYIL